MSANKVLVSWIYELSKTELIKAVQQQNIEISGEETVEQLRKLLVTVTRAHGEETVPTSALDNINLSESKPKIFSMAASKIKLEFQLHKDDWTTFVERLELYFEAEEVPESKKVVLLLTRIDPDMYMLVKGLCVPKQPKELKYSELVLLISQHLCPAPSEAMERCKFYKAHQATAESVADFVARLKLLSLHCSFQNIDEALRDQLVCGLQDEGTREELFCKSQLTFEKALQCAVSRETAKRNAADTRYSLNTQSTSVNFFKPNQKVALSKKAQRSRCYRCNRPGHFARECRSSITCNFCGIKGHLETACFKKKRNEKKKILHMQEEDNVNGTTPEDSQENYEFFPIFESVIKFCDKSDEKKINGECSKQKNVKVNLNNIKSESQVKSEEKKQNKLLRAEVYKLNEVINPYMVNVVVNNCVKIPFQIDTGSFVSVISQTTKNKLFPNLPLTPSDLSLTSYNNVKLCPQGILNNITVLFNNLERKLNLYVLEGKGPALMGRQWLNEFNLWPPKLLQNKDNFFYTNSENILTNLKLKFPNLFSSGQFFLGIIKRDTPY